MAQPQEFPFNIMDVAELLHLHIRRRQADSVYADCPICGDKRGKMNINFAKGIDGMIRGAQIRLDTPIRDQESDLDKSGTKYLWLSSASKKRGVSSGSPVHFVGDPFARVVYVTEGLLKADVSHYLMDRSFAATAGANNVNKLDMQKFLHCR